jgi:hypothetical protein
MSLNQLRIRMLILTVKSVVTIQADLTMAI